MIIKIIGDNNIDIVFIIGKEMISYVQKHIMQVSTVSGKYYSDIIN